MEALPFSEKPASFWERQQLPLFVILTFATSSFWVFLAWTIGDENLSILAVFMPSLVAIGLTWRINGRSALRDLLELSGRLKRPWLLAALLLIPIIVWVTIGIHNLFGGPPIGLRTTELLPTILVILLISFGEEYGWRGFLLPRLQQRYSALTASLILGLIWGFWHFPASLIGTGVPQEMPFWIFMLWVLAATILMTWVYNHTESMLAVILMHSSANAAFNYLWLLPEFVGQMQTFWLFLGVLWLITAVIVISFGAERLKKN